MACCRTPWGPQLLWPRERDGSKGKNMDGVRGLDEYSHRPLYRPQVCASRLGDKNRCKSDCWVLRSIVIARAIATALHGQHAKTQAQTRLLVVIG
jgi:hypothetical protein